MLVDANVVLYSVDEDSPFHDAARAWMAEALNGARRIGIPWQSLWAFVRIATNPRALTSPLVPALAWEHVTDWLDAPASWVPPPGRGNGEILGSLLVDKDLRAGLVTDAALAALSSTGWPSSALPVVSPDSPRSSGSTRPSRAGAASVMSRGTGGVEDDTGGAAALSAGSR